MPALPPTGSHSRSIHLLDGYPTPRSKTRDLIAKLYPSQGASFAPDCSAATPEPDVAYKARGSA